MLPDPRALFMLAVVIGVTGWVIKGLLFSWHRARSDRPAAGDRVADLEERLRKLEAATTGIMVDISNITEKQRFMARLQAGVDARDRVARVEQMSDSGTSPMVTQNIPIVPRARTS